jgi:hypothetical protein
MLYIPLNMGACHCERSGSVVTVLTSWDENSRFDPVQQHSTEKNMLTLGGTLVRVVWTAILPLTQLFFASHKLATHWSVSVCAVISIYCCSRIRAAVYFYFFPPKHRSGRAVVGTSNGKQQRR